MAMLRRAAFTKATRRWIGPGLACVGMATAVMAAQAEAPARTDVPATVGERGAPSGASLAGVEVTADLVYSTASGGRPLRLDLYAPSEPSTGPRPLVVFVHGGGWNSGDRRDAASIEDLPAVLASLARRGFVVASVEYRGGGEAPFPAAVEDVEAAIRFLREQGARRGIDSRRIAVWGLSTGAHPAAMAAFACGEASRDRRAPIAFPAACVQGFVGWFGPYDLASLLRQASPAARPPGAAGATPRSPPDPMPAPAGADLLGGLAFLGCPPSGCPAELVTRASPVNFVDRRDPPALLLHGTSDTLVPVAQSEALAARLRAAGVQVQVQRLDGVGHDWSGPTAEATQQASRRAVTLTFEFLGRLFPAAR